MRYLLLPLLLVAIACQNDLTLPESRPVDTPPAQVVQWAPKYNVPNCPAGTIGVSEIILHGQTPELRSSGDLKYFEGAENVLRRFALETYSYTDEGELCRKYGHSINWTRQNYDGVQHHNGLVGDDGYSWLSTAPPPAGGESSPSGFNFTYGKYYGTDRVIATGSPKVRCTAICPEYPGGTVADSGFVVVFYEDGF